MCKFTIHRNILKGLARAAASKDVRDYLNGVCFERGPNGSFCVATDGSIMAVYKLDDTTSEDDEYHRYIVPVADIDRLPKKGDGTTELTITGEHAADLADPVNAMTLHVELRHATYPDWRKVLPSTVTGQAGQFDPELLHRFTMMAKDFGKKSKPLFRIHHNGPNAAATIDIPGYGDFVGVIMPVNDRKPWVPPTWYALKFQ